MFSFIFEQTPLFRLNDDFQTFFSKYYFDGHHLCYYFQGFPRIKLQLKAQWVLVACYNFVNFPETANANSARSWGAVASSYYLYSIRVSSDKQGKEWRVSCLLLSVNCFRSSNTHRNDSEWCTEHGIAHVLKSILKWDTIHLP